MFYRHCQKHRRWQFCIAYAVWQNDTAKLQLFHKPARRWAFFLFLPRLSRHVIPALAYAWAWDLWLRPVIIIRLIMKTRHCISGWGRVVHSGLCPYCRFASSRGTKRSIYDRFAEDLFPKKNPSHFQLLTRQQTTIIDYKRLFNGLILTRVASLPR